MKIYRKNIKTSQVNESKESKESKDKEEKYTVRKMFSDLDKWENFIISWTFGTE